ncbi:glycine cleavage system protein H [Neorhodopirellula lusitana]|uniref:glycine cleavage system protein H n=1 Tax=Neorhodopirellula lusitana TaxID=445327 RepID=UPI00384A510D
MSDSFTFAMGEFDATFPSNYRYAKNHMWALPVADPNVASGTDSTQTTFRFGLTAYAVRLLQDVYFLDWTVEAPSPVKLRGEIGSIESKKAESDLFSPVAGLLTKINAAALDDPALINADPYDAGWLLEIQCEAGDSDILLTADQYAQHLEEAWQVAQRTIKGQANQ